MTSPPTRRLLLGLALLVLLVAAVWSPLASGTTEQRDPSPPLVTARPASDLVDSVGVGVHLGFLDTPYRRTDAVVAALQDLGVRHVRDELRVDQPRQVEALARLGVAGIRSSLVVGPRPDQADDPAAAGTPAENVAVLAGRLAGSVEAVEGLNEWDLWGGPTWVAQVRTWQQGLYDAVRASPALDGATVLAPSVAMRDNWTASGRFTGMADRANAHLYPDGRQPGARLAEKTRAFESQQGRMPVWITETGYHNTMGPPTRQTTGHPPVPERVAATYLPRLVVGALAAGVERTYLYELLDEFPDPSGTHREHNFGLLRHDLSPKPAYVALRELLRLASGGTGSREAGGSPLGLAVDGAPSDLRRLVLERPDGSSLVLLWRDVSVWDVTTRQPEPVTPAEVTLRLDRERGFEVHRIGARDGTVAQGSAERVGLTLGAELQAVVLAPAG